MESKEKSAVEDYIIEKLEKEKNWIFKKAKDLDRDNYQQPLLINNLIEATRRINDFELSENDMKRVLDELEYKTSEVQGVKEILNFLKKGIFMKLETGEERYIHLIDYENLDYNEFIVSRQVIYRSATDEIRPDIVLYVNGIPLVIIECKSPTDPKTSWEDAYNDIKIYEKTVPDLFKYVQFSIAAEQTAVYFPNVPWTDTVDIYTWRKGDFDVLDATMEMLSGETLRDLIKNFIFIKEEKGETTKVMPRYMQYRAVNKIFERVINTIQGREDKTSGLIWHWQGSGKTLAMILAGCKLFWEEKMGNPTIFFIIDRKTLESQLRDEFSALDLGVAPDIVSSVDELKDILLHGEGKGKRGVIVTLIHKFRPGDLQNLKKELQSMGEDVLTILTRKNVVAFIDEGHRTQYGDLASQMRAILNHAFFFAFTGTPIAKTGRDTYVTFNPPDEKYLDKYFMIDSIRDKFTVPIKFQQRLEKDAHLRKELLEQFIEQEFEEIPEEFEEQVEEKIKEKLTPIKVFMENPERIDLIARDIGEHFLENIDNKFKGMVVAVNRKACVLYKRALDKYLPPEYSEIVMTFRGKKEKEKEIWEYLEELQEKHHEKDPEEIMKTIKYDFKKEEYPKIVIVTEMLLAGYNAPVLQVMYLDKPLKEHKLLQAIARTNRPYKDVKEAGLILDYVGIFKDFEKAVAIYNSEDIAGVVHDIEETKKEFLSLLNEAKKLFERIGKNDDRDTLMAALKRIIKTKDNTRKFLRIFEELRKKFELLGPDPIKSEYKKEFKWITQVYYSYIRQVKGEDPEVEGYVKKYFKKTLDYVHETVEIDRIEKDFPIITLDEKYMERLEKIYPDRKDRISNMIFTLERYVLVDKTKTPVEESIVDKVERIVEEWREGKNVVDKYDEVMDIIQEYTGAGERQRFLGLTNLEYYTLLTLEKQFGKDPKLIKDARTLIADVQPEMFGGWSLQKSVEKKIEGIVWRKLRKYKIPKDEKEGVCDEIMGILRKYGKTEGGGSGVLV